MLTLVLMLCVSGTCKGVILERLPTQQACSEAIVRTSRTLPPMPVKGAYAAIECILEGRDA